TPSSPPARRASTSSRRARRTSEGVTAGTMTSAPRILMAASEMAPFAATGGLGDVLGALPPELAALGAQVHVVLPAYRTIPSPAAHGPVHTTLLIPQGDVVREAGLRTLQHRGVAVSFVV